MKPWLKIIGGVALSLMCLFTSIGYAATSGELEIHGSAEISPPNELFIVEVSQNGTNGSFATVNGFSSTVVSSKTTLGNSGGAQVTYTIRIFNNTDEDYGYNAMIYALGEGTYDNENIVVTPQIERRTVVNAGGFLSFDVIVTYKNSTQSANNVLNSVIKYEFLPLDEIPEDEGEIAVSGVLGQFGKILNNGVEGNPDSYGQLLSQMADYRNNDRHNDSYIGNVDGASDNDIALLDGLFQGQLSLNINGTDTPVTLMIKEEEIDGNTANGDEMTIYMTTHNLKKQNTGWFAPAEYASVYAAVFRKITLDNGTVEWEQVGEMYLGSAEIKQYNGRPGSGSFDTDNWRLLNQDGNRTSTTIENIIQTLE